MRITRLGLFVQSLFYVAAGANHFWHPGFYRHIMPDHYSSPDAMVQLSGLAEILGGVGLLHPLTRRVSATGIALMLVVFLDVHLYMVRHPGRFPEVPEWALWARIPLQFALIAWAGAYTRGGNQSPGLPDEVRRNAKAPNSGESREH